MLRSDKYKTKLLLTMFGVTVNSTLFITPQVSGVLQN